MDSNLFAKKTLRGSYKLAWYVKNVFAFSSMYRVKVVMGISAIDVDTRIFSQYYCLSLLHTAFSLVLDP